MNFNIGSMMGMMGGAPVTKSGDVIINKLKAAKVMEPGDMGDLMSSAIKNGLQSILKNPMQSSGSKAQQATNDAQNQVETSRFPETSSALDGLAAAVDNIMNSAANLVGVGTDPAGLLSTVAAAQTLASVSQVDPAYSLDHLLGPALADDEVNQVSDTLGGIVTAVVSRAISDGVGAQAVGSLNALLTDIVVRSDTVRNVAATNAVLLAQVAVAGSLLSAGAPAWQSVMTRSLQPDALAAVQDAIAQFLTIDDGEDV